MGGVNAELLERHPLLERLSEAQLDRFVQAGELELFQTGEDIVVQGTLGDALYLVLGGRAAVQAKGTAKPLAVLGAGEFFGEMSLIEPATRSATVRALEPCEVFRLPHVALANLLRDDPVTMNVVLVTIVRVLSQRLRRSNELIGSVKQLSEFLANTLVS